MSARSLAAIALALAVAWSPGAFGAQGQRPLKSGPKTTFSRPYDEGRAVAGELAKVTGVAITPLLGLTVIGVNGWLKASPRERPNLPWYQQPKFFVPGILMLVVLFIGHRLPVINRLAKLIKVWEDKLVAALAIPIVADTFATAVSKPIGDSLATAWGLLEPSAHAAGVGEVVAGTAQNAGHAVAWTLGIAVGFLVWLTSHAIDVLVLVSPFNVVDWVLKGLRTLLLGVLLGATMTNPWLGMAVSGVYLLVALILAGWAFRLLIFETVFSRDLLFRRWNQPFREQPLRAFASAGLRGVPTRTMGAIVRNEGGLAFRYRPWLVRAPRLVPLPNDVPLGVGRGLLSPVLLELNPERDAGTVLARFPPRYRLDARRLARALGNLEVQDASTGHGLKAAFGWLGEQTERRPAVREVRAAPAAS